jgi:hypothetical protein
VREHFIFTPCGRIAFLMHVPGHRHDTQGLYALLRTHFRGHLIGDNAYWPRPDMREKLRHHGITVCPATKAEWSMHNSPQVQRFIRKQCKRMERQIARLNTQFHTSRTLCRSRKHFEGRRWTKVMAFNLSRHINQVLHRPLESTAHFHLAA